MISSSSIKGRIGNTFFMVLVLGPGTQFILNVGYFLERTSNSVGMTYPEEINSYSERFKNTTSGFNVLFNNERMTYAQFPMRFGQLVIVTTTLWFLYILCASFLYLLPLFTIQAEKAEEALGQKGSFHIRGNQ